MKVRKFLIELLRGGRKSQAVSPAVKPAFSSANFSDGDLLLADRVNCSWPDLYYRKVQSLILMKKPGLVVEVGVAYGYHANFILSEDKSLSYVGIDPYVAAYDAEDLFFRDVSQLFDDEPQEAMNRLFAAVEAGLLRDFGSRAKIHREASLTAVDRFERHSLPFVFLDGDHRYEAVLADLRAWWPKVEPGGILCGDDYLWSGVQQAVSEFFQDETHEVFLLRSPHDDHVSFYVVKAEEAVL